MLPFLIYCLYHACSHGYGCIWNNCFKKIALWSTACLEWSLRTSWNTHLSTILSATISYHVPCENLNVPTCCPLWCILCILLVVMDTAIFETIVLRRLSYTYQRWSIIIVKEAFFFIPYSLPDVDQNSRINGCREEREKY